MKNILFIIFGGIVIFASCAELDLNPLSEGSSESWYSNESEINMSLNDFYREDFWVKDQDNWTDDWTERQVTYEPVSGTITSEWAVVRSYWQNNYKVIARVNTLLSNLEKVAEEIPQENMNKYIGEAHFIRATMYSNLISHYGDVPFYTEPLDIEESFELSRTDKDVILEAIYQDYDLAIQNLPENYGGSELTRATKGAAMAFKARIALYMSDWATARDAAKACMDLKIYSLHPDYGEYFLSKTKNSFETIFAIPRSAGLDAYFFLPYRSYNYPCRGTITRNNGGWMQLTPSWELLSVYPCTDGLPIDESPLYNPQKPFENRDPRCTMTIVEFETAHLGFIYDPNPYADSVLNLSTGLMTKNNDSRINTKYASYNGMAWKKGVDEDWIGDMRTDTDHILMRYADVLLMYAEAKIELGETDQTVLNAINQVRARAYGVDFSQTSDYPAVAVTTGELRDALRLERRIELTWEGLRYMDLIRWRLAEKALTRNIYGMLDPAELKEKVVDPGLWFFPETPEIDEDGIADLDPMYNAGLIKLLAIRNFDGTRQYLWPIPAKEILINENLTQNPGY